jgi:hypothetical protein
MLKQFLSSISGHFNIMVKECAWCGHIKGFVRGGKGITSGICQKCAAIQDKKFTEYFKENNKLAEVK